MRHLYPLHAAWQKQLEVIFDDKLDSFMWNNCLHATVKVASFFFYIGELQIEVFLPAEKSVFLSYTNKGWYFHPLKQILTVTNELILAVTNEIKVRKLNGYIYHFSWMGQRSIWGQMASPTTQALTRSVLMLKARFDRLKKLRSSKKEKYMIFYRSVWFTNFRIS